MAKASPHFAQHYYQKGWYDATHGNKLYDSPKYNNDDRYFYTLGFNEARADL